MFPLSGMQCVSPQTALVRHTNKVSVSLGCLSLAVVFVPLGRESICPHERLTKLLRNDTVISNLYLDILCFFRCSMSGNHKSIINVYYLFVALQILNFK